MRENERGSTLIPVLASVLILTIMLSALMSVSAREISDMNRSVGGTTSLTNLRSYLQAIYVQFQTQWGSKWNTLVANHQTSDINAVENALEGMTTSINGWCTDKFKNEPIHWAIHSYPQDNNFSAIEESFAGASALYQKYQITIQRTDGGMSQTLTDTVTVSGAIDSLNYAIYAPWTSKDPSNTGNITILGAPEIDGRVAAGNSIYVDPVPWQGTAVDTDINSYVTIPDPHSLLPQPYRFWPEPSFCEPMVLPKIVADEGISSGNGIHAFTSYSDQDGMHLFGTDELGNSSYVSDASKALTSSNIGQYLDGNLTPSSSVPSLPSDYVTQILNEVEPSIKKQAIASYNDGYGRYKKDKQLSGYVHLQGGEMTAVAEGIQNVSGPLYVDGDLTIDTNAVLELSQPLYVAGNLVIKGMLDSSASIYVSGRTTIMNVPVDKPGMTPPRLEIFSGDDIALSFSTNWFGPTASSPTTLHAFLASGANVYVEGMTSFYKLIGGVCGQNVILNATVGAQQFVLGPWLYALNANDHTRRLLIQYDNSYISNPLTGTPTLGKMQVQNLPLPYVSSP